MDRKNLLLLLLIIGTAFWGISYSVTKIAVDHASSSTFLFYRFLGATLVLSVVFRKSFKTSNLGIVGTGAGLAIPLVFNSFSLTLGIKYTSASQASFLTGMCVIIVPLLKLIFFRTTVPLKTWIAGLIALTGLFIICIKDGFSISAGDLYTITGALGFSIYLIRVEKVSKGGNIIPTIVPMFAMCTVISGCLAIADNSATWLPESNGFWIGILYCALFSTAYMYTVSNIAQRYISSEKVAIIYLFEPVFGAAAAFLILGESLSWRLLSGGCLIFAGTFISETNISNRFRKSHRRQPG